MLSPQAEQVPNNQYIRFLRENARPFFKIESTNQGAELVQTPTVWESVLGQRFRLEKPSQIRRILVIGESNAQLLGRELRDALAGSPVSDRFEIMNCGIGAGSIEMVRRRFDEALNYSPDAVIFAFGHNVFYDHLLLPEPLLDLSLWAQRSRLISFFARRLGRERVDAFSPARRFAALRELVVHVGREAKNKHIPALIVILPSNLWYAPTDGSGGRLARPFLEAIYRYHSGRRRQAIAELERALVERPVALWHFTLGDWLARQGRHASALRHLIFARDLDMARNRSSREINALLRDTAARSGITIFDGERWLSKKAPHGAPGWESFVDNQHLRPAIYRAWAIECLRLLHDAGWTQLGLGFSRASRALTLEDELHWALSMIPLQDETVRLSLIYLSETWLRDFARSGEAAINAVEPDALRRAVIKLHLAEAYWRSGRKSVATTLLEKIRGSQPSWAEPDLRLGLHSLESGDLDAARRWFRNATQKEPGRENAMILLGLANAKKRN